MPIAEIISIGTELLLGEIPDTNTQYIARALRRVGIDLYRTCTIGDNLERIAEVIQEAIPRADIILTTGGLGPTVDDPTREAVALALGVKTEFHPELWQQIVERFANFRRTPSENNRRMAHIPQGAKAFENPLGTAPAFWAETNDTLVISLPGVPREMEYLLDHVVIPFLRAHFKLEHCIRIRTLHTTGVGESQIDERISDLEKLQNPTVGLAAHAGQVDVRITAKAHSEEEAAVLIQPVEAELRARLGHWVFGADEETLAGVTLQGLDARDWKLVALEAGLDGKLLGQLTAIPDVLLHGEILPSPSSHAETLKESLSAALQKHQADAGLAVSLHGGPEQYTATVVVLTPEGARELDLSVGNPRELAIRRAVNFSLNILRWMTSSPEE